MAGAEPRDRRAKGEGEPAGSRVKSPPGVGRPGTKFAEASMRRRRSMVDSDGAAAWAEAGQRWGMSGGAGCRVRRGKGDLVETQRDGRVKILCRRVRPRTNHVRSCSSEFEATPGNSRRRSPSTRVGTRAKRGRAGIVVDGSTRQTHRRLLPRFCSRCRMGPPLASLRIPQASL